MVTTDQFSPSWHDSDDHAASLRRRRRPLPHRNPTHPIGFVFSTTPTATESPKTVASVTPTTPNGFVSQKSKNVGPSRRHSPKWLRSFNHPHPHTGSRKSATSVTHHRRPIRFPPKTQHLSPATYPSPNGFVLSTTPNPRTDSPKNRNIRHHPTPNPA
jgi:hypothetical protein